MHSFMKKTGNPALLLSLFFLFVFSGCGDETAGEDDDDDRECPSAIPDAQCFLLGAPGLSGMKCLAGHLMHCMPSKPISPVCLSTCDCDTIPCTGDCVDVEQNGNAYCGGVTNDGDMISPDGDEADGDAVLDGDVDDKESEIPVDGDCLDGDAPDGDMVDGDDIPDGDGDPPDGDFSDGDTETDMEREEDGEADEESEEPLVFDHDLIRDENTAQCAFSNEYVPVQPAIMAANV